MNIKKKLSFLSLIIFPFYLNAAAETAKKEFDQQRYNQILVAFNENINTFFTYFSPKPTDSDIIKQHKEKSQEDLAEHKEVLETSWKPAIFNMLGGIFGISALSSGALPIPIMLLGSGIFNTKTRLEAFGKIVSFPLKYTGTGLLTRPIMLPINFILWELHENKYISRSQYNLGWSALLIGRALLFAGIAKYLLNKASSYADEIKNIEKDIARDEKMIEALEKLPSKS